MPPSFCSFWHGQLGLIPPGARHLAAACLEGKPLQLPSVQAVVDCSFWPQGIRAAADVLSSLQPSQTRDRLPSHHQRLSVTEVLAAASGQAAPGWAAMYLSASAHSQLPHNAATVADLLGRETATSHILTQSLW